MNFEESLKRLNEIVSAIENGDLDLNKSLELFEEGTQIIKDCNKVLDEAEQKVKILINGQEEDFIDD